MKFSCLTVSTSKHKKANIFCNSLTCMDNNIWQFLICTGVGHIAKYGEKVRCNAFWSNDTGKTSFKVITYTY